MNLIIAEEILQQSPECQFNYKCQQDEKYPLCQVEYHAGNTIFITRPETFCRYAMIFGSSIVCNCQTRREIFRKYMK